MARLRAGFRIPQDAADAIGCSRPLVLAWENGSAKSIGSKYLLAVAKAYRVDPEWLTLNTDTDGYPYASPESVAETVTAPAPASHFQRPDPVTLRTALDLLAFDEDQAGPYSPPRQAERLADLYALVAADGGVALSEESNARYDDYVWARAARRAQGTAEHGTTTAPTSPGRNRRG